MKHWGFWGRRSMGALAALALLTHCGGVDTGEQAAREVRPQTPSVLRQGVTSTRTFSAIADARVVESSPTSNFGAETRLVADLDPRQESYLRFSVSGVTGRVTRAVLRLYALDGTSKGPRVFVPSGDWTEGGLTWSNRPAPDSTMLDTVGAISTGTWVEFDVSGYVGRNSLFDFAVIGDSGNGADFASREYGQEALRPQLVLTVDEAPPEPTDCMPRTDTRIEHFVPLADGYVSEGEPTRRFGTAPELLVDAAPQRYESFLRFQVLARPGWFVREATLRVHATNGTSDGPVLYRASSDWASDDFDWYGRPALFGGPVGNVGTVSTHTWVEYDVTREVTGGGAYAFALLPDSTNGADFHARESASEALRPQLRVVLETAPYCTYRGTGGAIGWMRPYGGAGPERLSAMASDASGGFVAAGRFGGEPFPGEAGFALARYTPEGVPLWSRRVTTGDATVVALTVTPEGNILAVGTYYGAADLGSGPLPAAPEGSFARGLFLAKFTPAGQTVWSRGFRASYMRGGTLEDWPIYPRAVTTDAQGSLIVTGDFHGIMDLGGGPLFAGEPSVFPMYESYSGGFLAKFSWQGEHLWSRVFQNTETHPVTSRSVAVDGAGNILIGGWASRGTDLGDGTLGEFAPFIARYDTDGALLWKRLFSGLYGVVSGVQPLEGDAVAFIADFRGTFTFAGRPYVGGDPDYPSPYDISSFIGTLSASRGDGWLRGLGNETYTRRLVTGEGGALTVTGTGSVDDWGGGLLGSSTRWMTFVARYSRTGSHLWSRALDPTLGDPSLATQPGGTVLLGGHFSEPFVLDGNTLSPSGPSDLLYLQLRP